MDLGIHCFILFLSIVSYWCWCWLRQGLGVRSIWRQRRIISFVMVVMPMVLLKVGIMRGICLVEMLEYWGQGTLRKDILNLSHNQVINLIHNIRNIHQLHLQILTLLLLLQQPTNSTTQNAQASWSTYQSSKANKPTTTISSAFSASSSI